ncbi:hypothetical protein GCM10009759_55020 [Kitasatospora saccharophila]|uniref:Uncharacterized protein n=1 Tax=Kitasatospora saccharophila TaxID=407973 RepID=A0ABN2XJ89_9ACTN
MSARPTAPAAYRVETLRMADGMPVLGIRRPDDTWHQSMGQPASYYNLPNAERSAAELNRIHGLAGTAQP